jgi:hypothetical protein
MRTVACRAVWVVAGLALLVMSAARPAALHRAELPDAEVLTSVPVPDAVGGLSFAGDHLWSIDAKKNMLLKIDPASGAVVATQPLEVRKAKGLAWDGRSFWCGRDGGRFIEQVDASSGKVLKSFDRSMALAPPQSGSSAQAPAESQYSLQALAWDGKSLWGVFERGMGSSVVRINVADGRTVNATTAQGIPLGLASNGKWLWMATYDTGNGRALLVRWAIPQENEVVSTPAQGIARTRTIVARLPGKDPAGLAWDGGALWYADKKLKTIMKLQLPPES